MRSLAAALLVLGTAPASARPLFVTLDRQDLESRAGVELTYISPEMTDKALLRFDVHGHYVDETARAGGYVTLPMAYVTGDPGEGAVGNLELGGIYVPDLSASTTTTLVLHGGVVLPTARDEGPGAFVGVAAGYVRPHDIYQTIPKTTTVRGGLATLIRGSDTVQVRFDGGVDVDVDGGAEDGVTPAVHVNAGVGFLVSETASLAFELATMTTFLDVDSETNAVGALAFRVDADRVLPYLAVVVPFDDQSSSLVDIAFAVGLDVRL